MWLEGQSRLAWSTGWLAGNSRFLPATRAHLGRGRLFCALTNRLISADMEAVKVHLKGKKFLKAKGKSVLGAAVGGTCMDAGPPEHAIHGSG